jgi:hypothetical protein
MNLTFCSLSADMSDDELKECIHKVQPRCVSTGRGCLITVNGYDRDPRELWQIPEVKAFFNRLIDFGFLSVMELMAQQAMPGTPGFGAVEVWMVATDKITKYAKYEVGKEELDAVVKIVKESNVKCEAILAATCPSTGIKVHEQQIRNNTLCEIGRSIHTKAAQTTVSDGPMRHGTYWSKK